MSTILKELAAAVGMTYATDPKSIETITVAVSKLEDKAWNKVSDAAQDWTNDCIDSLSSGKGLIELPDMPAAEPEPTTRRRRADPEPAAGAEYVAKVGDEVTVLTKRGKTITGKVTMLDDGGELVLLCAHEEIGVTLHSIDKITGPAAVEPEPTTRRRKSADAEPTGPVEPALGDTVEIINKRDKVFLGNVTELDDEVIVIKTLSGEELDFEKKLVKSVVVKVQAKAAAPADAAPAGRGRRAATTTTGADAEGGRTRASNAGGISVGTRIRELILDNKGITEDQVRKKLEAEGLKFADASLNMNYKDTIKFLAMLTERKMLK